jgi:toxin ParE1/3/4
MKPVVFHPEARAELDAAVAYYEAQRPGLGLDCQAHVEQVINEIQQYPGRGTSVQAAGLRRRLVSKFPYSVFYLEHDSAIEIIAVAHHRRQPGYRAHRVP